MSEVAAPTRPSQAELSAKALRCKQATEEKHRAEEGEQQPERPAGPRSSERRAKSINQFADDWDVSPSMVWKQIRLGRIEAVKVGNRTLITAEAEAKYSRNLPRARAAVAA
jgi:hypothetical protein